MFLNIFDVRKAGLVGQDSRWGLYKCGIYEEREREREWKGDFGFWGVVENINVR